jgi:TolB-like protein
MFKKTMVLFVFLALVGGRGIFSQSITLDTALANAGRDIAESVPNGTKIAVLNIESDYPNLSDYIINELIVNLVNTRKFQIVPRRTVELEVANREFGFQMTGYVSDESQKRLGQFLGAGTIITGTVTRDSANSFRLVVNAIDLESFTYQSSYPASIQNNGKVRTLIAGSGGISNEDYTAGERIGMGALNMFFGIGSIMKGQKLGWVVTGTEALGVILLSAGLAMDPMDWNGSTIILDGTYNGVSGQEVYDRNMRDKNALITAGAVVIGSAIVFGYIIPIFHHKPGTTNVAHNNFPFNLELVSTNQGIDGFIISYNIRF